MNINMIIVYLVWIFVCSFIFGVLIGKIRRLSDELKVVRAEFDIYDKFLNGLITGLGVKVYEYSRECIIDYDSKKRVLPLLYDKMEYLLHKINLLEKYFKIVLVQREVIERYERGEK